MNAKTITTSLGGKWHGVSGNEPCPICQQAGRRDQTALSIRDGDNGRLLLFCHRGGCDFIEILAAAGLRPADYQRPSAQELARRRIQASADDAAKALSALAIWEKATPIAGTMAEAYLRGRAITCDLPDALRFDPAAYCGKGCAFPAMVSRVEGYAGPAVHRTFLYPDGTVKQR